MRDLGETAALLGGTVGQLSGVGDIVILTPEAAQQIVGELLPNGVGCAAQSGPRDVGASGGQAQTSEVVMSEAKPSSGGKPRTSDDESGGYRPPFTVQLGWGDSREFADPVDALVFAHSQRDAVVYDDTVDCDYDYDRAAFVPTGGMVDDDYLTAADHARYMEAING